MTLFECAVVEVREYHSGFLYFIDDSSSMFAKDGADTRFDLVKEDVLALLGSLRGRDTATVITFGGNIREVGDTRDDNLLILLDRIKDLQAGKTGGDLDTALSLASAAASPELVYHRSWSRQASHRA